MNQLNDKENPKKSFQVKIRKANNGVLEKAIFIDNEQLDWSIDLTSLMDAKKMGPHFFKAAQKNIEEHFIESVSEVIGRKITVNELKRAIATGWI